MKHSEEINYTTDLNILLVDDDGDDCDLFKTVLKELGSYRFTCGMQSGKLYEFIDQAKPHLIFLDINMPEKNGIVCLKELKSSAQYKHIPVIIYSVSADNRDQEACRHAGAHHYLVKPYLQMNLHTSLKKLLSRDWKI